MTKHVEKVEEVKKEVGFFNSYLKVRVHLEDMNHVSFL